MNMNKIAILFSGQGAQAAGMGKDLYDASEEAKALYDLGDSIRPGTENVCFNGPQEDLTLTKNAQPALFLTDLAFAEALKNAGVQAAACAGFSLGEIPALAFSGILSDADAFRLVCARADKMAELSDIHKGGMAAALKMKNEDVERVCGEFTEVWPVNYNCPGQLSCAGSPEQIDAFVDRIKAEGGRAVKLQVSGAFHTPYMKDAQPVLAETMGAMQVNAPAVKIYSNRTGKPYPLDKAGIIEQLSNQVCSPVQWETIIRTMAEEDIGTYIEVGAGKTLTGFMKRIIPEAQTFTVTDAASLQSTLEALKEISNE